MSINKRTVRAAAVQIAPDLDSADGTVAKVCEAIAQAAAQGAELVVFPETFVPYYPYFSFVRPPFAAGPEHLLLYERAVELPGPGHPGRLCRGSAVRHGGRAGRQ
ncbi:putative amidohydrolase [Herbaspirillum rubrisubalbicans]|nr:putative amidohydrolase [Herbaspirillum rubrisubalbicans]